MQIVSTVTASSGTHQVFEHGTVLGKCLDLDMMFNGNVWSIMLFFPSLKWRHVYEQWQSVFKRMCAHH